MKDIDKPDPTLAAHLRQLPDQRPPPASVWAAVAAHIEAQPVAAPPPIRRSGLWRRRGLRRGLGWAAAASVAALALLWSSHPRQPPMPGTPAAPAAPLLVQQADAMSGEYRRAMAALPPADASAELRPALRELDASALAIHSALRQQPDADFLLNQLRRTYAKRLELTRMATLNPSRPS